MGFAAGFSAGFNAVDEGLKRRREDEQRDEINKVLNEKPVTSTEPTYKGMTGSLDEQDIPTRQKTTYMGKEFDAAPSEQEIQTLRTKGIADVLRKSDPLKALEFEGKVKDREQRDYEIQKGRDADKSDKKYKKEVVDFSKSSAFGRIESEFKQQQSEFEKQVSAYDERLKAGERGAALGLRPMAPVKREYTNADRLSDAAAALDLQTKYGKANPDQILKFGEMVKQIRDEGYTEALQLHQAGVPMADVVAKFDATGTKKADIRKVISDQTLPGKNGEPPRRVTKYEDSAGNIKTMDSLAELDAIGKSEKIYDRAYKLSKLSVDERNANANERRASAAESNAAANETRASRPDAGPGAAKPTALQKDIEYLMSIGVAKTPEEAAKFKANPFSSKADFEKRIYETLVKDPLNSPERAKAKARLAADNLPSMVAQPADVNAVAVPQPKEGGGSAMKNIGDGIGEFARGARELIAPGSQPKSFASESEVEAAAAKGLVKKGDRIVINGRSARFN